MPEVSSPSARGSSFRTRFAGFAGLPLVSLLAPFLLLPVIARVGGVSGWAAIAIGQSVGGFAAIVVTFAWALVGPARVAAANEETRSLIYGDSIVSRTLLFLVAAPPAVIIAYALGPPGHELESAAMALAMISGSLSPAWFAIGVGRPGLIAVYDVIPRLIGILIALGLVLATGSIIPYPVCLIVATLFGATFFSVRVGKLHRRNGIGFGRVVKGMWNDRAAGLADLAAGTYSATPAAIISVVASPLAVATFTSGQNLFRVGLFTVQATGSAFQGWVAERGAAEGARRMRLSLIGHTGLGVAGLLVMTFAAVPVSRLLFGDHVAVDQLSAIFFGIAFLGVSVTTSTGRHILVPWGLTNRVLQSTLIGAVVGVASMIWLGGQYGAPGGAAGLAAGEAVVAIVQFAAIWYARRRRTSS